MPWSLTGWCDFTDHEIADAPEDPGLICVSLGEKGGPDHFIFGEDIREALKVFWDSTQSRQFRDVGRFSFKVMPLDAALTLCAKLRAEAVLKLSLPPSGSKKTPPRRNRRVQGPENGGVRERRRR